jgi:hypothetical protein
MSQDKLVRYGIRWNGPTEPICEPMEDGYWTPWHIAQALIEEAYQERKKWAKLIRLAADSNDDLVQKLQTSIEKLRPPIGND